MDFNALLTFLDALNKNNSKEWMDEHRKEYKSLRAHFINWLDGLNARLTELDPDYYSTPGKVGINRINNNLMFHPHKPIYKDHFGAGLDKAPGFGDYYVEIGLHQSLIAGGVWRPNPFKLRSIREAIDYNGEELIAIINKPSFKKKFGGLYVDQRLKTAPKGFSKNHPYLSLLQHKSYGVVHNIARNKIFSTDFDDYVLDIYQEMLPFRRYLNQALTV
ncbi:MAG: DUF2461 domain-containing protein [Eudoraea sp.]